MMIGDVVNIRMNLFFGAANHAVHLYEIAMTHWYDRREGKVNSAPSEAMKAFFNAQVAVLDFTHAAKKYREKIIHGKDEQKEQYDHVVKDMIESIKRIANQQFNAICVIPKNDIGKENEQKKFQRLANHTREMTERFLIQINDQVIVWP